MEHKNKKKKKTLTFINTNPQLTNSVVEGSAVAKDRVSAKIFSIIEKRKKNILENSSLLYANLSEKTEHALIRKSENTGISLNILREVYHRGYNDKNKKISVTQEQNGFNRVNSFIKGGKARVLDKDLFEKKNKKQAGFIETKPKIPAAEAQAPDTKVFVATSNAMSEQQDVWDKPNPVKNSKKLSPEQKAKAKARAKAAGRPYPNMVDNIAVARTNESLIKTIKSQLKVLK